MTNPKPSADQGDVLLKILRHSGNVFAYEAASKIEELQAKRDEANKRIADLQGRLDAIEGQSTEMWLIKYTDPENGLKRMHVFLHNAIEDYKKLYTDATVTELIPRVSPL